MSNQESTKIQVTHKNALLILASLTDTLVTQNRLIIQQLGNIAMLLQKPTTDVGGSDARKPDNQQ